MNGHPLDPHAEKIDRVDLEDWSDRLRGTGERLIFTNGCFDLIHRGHVEYLAEAAAFGGRLLVAVNSDSSIRRLKGAGRPILPLVDRIAVLAALRSVSALTIFDEPTPIDTIRLVKPDVLIKGAEYAEEDIVGAQFVRENGGTIERIAMREGRSTTALIEAIKRLP